MCKLVITIVNMPSKMLRGEKKGENYKNATIKFGVNMFGVIFGKTPQL